jgi:hypothetical protein
MEDRFTTFNYRGTLLFQELFPNELEVLESEMLEAKLEDLVLNNGETIQILTIPNFRDRTSLFNFNTNQFKVIAKRLELIIYWLTDRKNYDELAKDDKSIAQLRDPTSFAIGDYEYVKRSYYAYNRFTHFPLTININDFSFLSILNQHYKKRLYSAIENEQLKRFRLKAFDIDPNSFDDSIIDYYTDRTMSFMMINPNPGQTVNSLDGIKMIMYGYDLLIANYTYYQLVNLKETFHFNISTLARKVIARNNFIPKKNIWNYYNAKIMEPIDFAAKVKQQPIESSVTSNALLEMILYYALLKNFMENRINVDFGSSKFQFVNANWSVERLRLSIFLSTIMSKYLNNKTIVTIQIRIKGLLLLIDETGKEFNLMTDFVQSFNDAVEIMEDSMFVD